MLLNLHKLQNLIQIQNGIHNQCNNQIKQDNKIKFLVQVKIIIFKIHNFNYKKKILIK